MARLVMIGAATDVPVCDPVAPEGRTTMVPLPKAITSGLYRPSAVGPIELKTLFEPAWLTDPTDKIPTASAGGVTSSQKLLPSFPALHITTMPRSIAAVAACVTIAVDPF